jgi:hypothetical protein
MHGVLRAYDGSHQIIDDPTFLCQQGEDKAAVKYAKKHLGALAACRDAINAGTLAVTPAQCPSDPATASRQADAGRAVRASVAARCSDSLLGGLVACDTTLDGLIAPAGDGGCFVTLHDAGLDAVLATVYGTAPPPLPAAETLCQAAIGKAAVGYTKTYYKGRRKEIEAFLRGKSFSPYDQANANTRALLRANMKVAAVCTDVLVAGLSTCASTVEGIIDSFGGYGCLRTAVEDAVEDALLSIYAP